MKKYNLSSLAVLYLNEVNGEDVYNHEVKEDRKKALRNFQLNYRDKIDHDALVIAAQKYIEIVSKEIMEDVGV